jgi:hypothetical protein
MLFSKLFLSVSSIFFVPTLFAYTGHTAEVFKRSEMKKPQSDFYPVHDDDYEKDLRFIDQVKISKILLLEDKCFKTIATDKNLLLALLQKDEVTSIEISSVKYVERFLTDYVAPANYSIAYRGVRLAINNDDKRVLEFICVSASTLDPFGQSLKTL